MNILTKLFYTFLVVSILSCGDSSSSSSDDSGWQSGTIDLQFDSETFEDDVRVYFHKEDGITMYSDENDVVDSDEDGLIIALFQFGDNLQFDFVNDGTRYGGVITNWTHNGNMISGTGVLRLEDQFTGGTNISFEILLD